MRLAALSSQKGLEIVAFHPAIALCDPDPPLYLKQAL